MADCVGRPEAECAAGGVPAYGRVSGAFSALALGDGAGGQGRAAGEGAEPVWVYGDHVAGSGQGGGGGGASRCLAEVDCAGAGEPGAVGAGRQTDPLDLQ